MVSNITVDIPGEKSNIKHGNEFTKSAVEWKDLVCVLQMNLRLTIKLMNAY